MRFCSKVMSNMNVVIVKEYCFSDLFKIFNSKVLDVALIVWEWSIGAKPQTERWNLVIVKIEPHNSSLFKLKI